MSDSSFASSIAQALPEGFALREREASDMDFLCELYARSREDELRPVAWSPEQKRAFLGDQFGKQHAYYLEHYPGANWWVIIFQGQPVGRVYVYVTAGEQRLMDICLVNELRGRGVGTAILRALLQEADRAGVEASLHVEPYNPALRLYRRLGYEQVEVRGAYLFMRRRVAGVLVKDDFVAGAGGRVGDGHQEQLEPAMGRVL